MLQKGKGATGGIMLNNMNNISGGVFDSKTSSVFLLRFTMFFSFLFIITSLILCQISYRSDPVLQHGRDSVIIDNNFYENMLVNPN